MFRYRLFTQGPTAATQGTHYADWSTIDWLNDQARDRLRHQVITDQKHESLWKRFVSLHDALSGWFVNYPFNYSCSAILLRLFYNF